MPLTPLELSCAALAVFCAGLIRGATGFGFSMICIVLLTLLLPPAHIAPVIMLWEIAASVGHLPFVYKEADWKALRHLALGVALGTPPGAYCLALAPAAPMTAVINTVVLVLTGMLFFGFKLRQRPGRWGACGVGALTGLINGASANGGPPVILFFLSGPSSVAVSRASLIAFFLFTDVLAAVVSWGYGLMTGQVFLLAAVMLPCVGLGIWLGSRWFRRVDEVRFRRVVLALLLLISLAGLLPSLISITG